MDEKEQALKGQMDEKEQALKGQMVKNNKRCMYAWIVGSIVIAIIAVMLWFYFRDLKGQIDEVKEDLKGQLDEVKEDLNSQAWQKFMAALLIVLAILILKKG